MPPGSYTVTISYLNAGTSSQQVTIVPGQSLDLSLMLADGGDGAAGDTIIVTGARGALGLARAQELGADQFKTIV